MNYKMNKILSVLEKLYEQRDGIQSDIEAWEHRLLIEAGWIKSSFDSFGTPKTLWTKNGIRYDTRIAVRMTLAKPEEVIVQPKELM